MIEVTIRFNLSGLAASTLLPARSRNIRPVGARRAKYPIVPRIDARWMRPKSVIERRKIWAISATTMQIFQAGITRFSKGWNVPRWHHHRWPVSRHSCMLRLEKQGKLSRLQFLPVKLPSPPQPFRMFVIPLSGSMRRSCLARSRQCAVAQAVSAPTTSGRAGLSRVLDDPISP